MENGTGRMGGMGGGRGRGDVESSRMMRGHDMIEEK